MMTVFFFLNVISNEVDGFFLFAQFHLMTLGLSLCSPFSLLNVMFRNELFPHGLLLLESSPFYLPTFWKGKTLNSFL